MKLGTLLVAKGKGNYVGRNEIKVGCEISISKVKDDDKNNEMENVADYLIENDKELAEVNAEIAKLRKTNSMVYVSIA